MKKLILTIIVLSIGAIGFFAYDLFTATEGEGRVTIVIVDENDDIIYNQVHDFTEEDTLFSLMNDTFELQCANNMYQPTDCANESFFGTVVLVIDDMTTNWTIDYIALYINDEYSNFGIDGIQLHDGDTYRFEYTLVEELSP